MTTTLWIALAVAVLLVIGYVVAMRNLVQKSRDVDKQIDYSKIRKWEDEER